jgi:hypothetical protein
MGHEPVHPIDTRSHMRLRARVRRIYNKGFAVALNYFLNYFFKTPGSVTPGSVCTPIA